MSDIWIVLSRREDGVQPTSPISGIEGNVDALIGGVQFFQCGDEFSYDHGRDYRTRRRLPLDGGKQIDAVLDLFIDLRQYHRLS